MIPGAGRVRQSLADRQSATLGRLAGAGIMSTGRIHIVKDPSDTDYNEAEWAVDILGANIYGDKWHRTIAAGVAALRDGVHDYLFVCPKSDNSSWAPGASVTLDLNHVHLIGVGTAGSRPIIEFAGAYVLTLGGSTGLLGVELGNVEVKGTGASHVVTLLVHASTANAWIHDSKIHSSTGAAATFDVDDDSDDALFQRCLLGNGTTAHTNTGYFVVNHGSTCRGPVFEDCIFVIIASDAGDAFGNVGGTANPVILRRCLLYNNSATAMTAGFIAANKMVYLEDCSMLQATAMGTTAKSLTSPGGVTLVTTASDVYNPRIGIDGAEPIAVDT